MKTTDIKKTIEYIQPGEDVTASITNRPMVDLEENLDRVISYLTTSPIGHFDIPETISGVDLEVSAGRYKEGDGVIDVPQATLTLQDNNTNYVFIDTNTTSSTNGQISFNTTGFTTDMIPLYEVTVSGGSITTINDRRTFIHKSPQFSGDKVVVTDPNTGEVVEHPSVSIDELGHLDGVTNNIQQQLNQKVDISGHLGSAVMVTNNLGQIQASPDISINELLTLNTNHYNIRATFDRTVFRDISQTIKNESSPRTDLIVAADDEAHFILRRVGTTGTNSYMYIDLYDNGYGRINLPNTDTLGNTIPNTKFEILADGSVYTFEDGELTIDGAKVLTEAANTAQNSLQLGGIDASNYIRSDIIDQFDLGFNIANASGSSFNFRNDSTNTTTAEVTYEADTPTNNVIKISPNTAGDKSFFITERGNIAVGDFISVADLFLNTGNTLGNRSSYIDFGVSQFSTTVPLNETTNRFYGTLVVEYVTMGCHNNWAIGDLDISIEDPTTATPLTFTVKLGYRLGLNTSINNPTVYNNITIPFWYVASGNPNSITFTVSKKPATPSQNTETRIRRVNAFVLPDVNNFK